MAGGRASRMQGIAKGLIQIEGQSLMERLIGQLHASWVRDCVIIANNPSPYLNLQLPIVPDLRQGVGPLAGIESGLSRFAQQSHGVLFLPCDLPGITTAEINTLIKAFRNAPQPVVFAQTGDSDKDWHPLCAVVHVDVLSTLSSAIDRQVRAVRDFWSQVDAAGVRFTDESRFVNINELHDLEQWRKRTRP